MSSYLRWGICSAGKISNDFAVALSTLSSDKHRAVAVAARDLTRAKQFADRFKIAKAYGDYESLAKDRDIDVVYIGNLNPDHKKTCILMMDHGKNVLCEKPLTINEKDTNEVLDYAKSKNVFFMEGYWSRFFPVYCQIREELNSKTIGDVKFVNAAFTYKISHVDRINKKELGGGVLLDLGCYVIQLATMVFGCYPEKVIANGALLDSGVDIACSMTFMYPGNRLAHLYIDGRSHSTCHCVISGDDGYIQIPETFWCPTRLEVKGEMKEFPLPPTDFPTFFPNSVGLRYEADAVRDCIEKGLKEHQVASHEHSRIIARLITECRRQLGVHFPEDD